MPGAQHRILLVPLVQRDGAVVGIHHGLHRVAHVVDLAARSELLLVVSTRIVSDRIYRYVFCVRIRVRGCVPVHDPNQTLRRLRVPIHVNHCRVRLAVQRQVWGGLCHAQGRIAIVEDLRLLVYLVTEEQVSGLESQSIQELVPEVSKRRTTIALEGVVYLA